MNPSSKPIAWDIIDVTNATIFNSDTGTITNLNKSGEVAVTASIGTDAKTQQLTFKIRITDAAIPKSSPEPSLSLDPTTPNTNVVINSSTHETSISNKFINRTSAPIIWSSSNDMAATVVDGKVTIVDSDLITTTPPVTITASVGSSNTQQVVFTLVKEPEAEPEPEPKTEPGYTFNYKNAESELINGMVLTPIYLNELVTVDPSNTKIIWRMETEVDNTVAILANDAFVAKQEGVYTINGALSIDPKKTLPITITVLRPKIKIAEGRDTKITKTPETNITLNEEYVTVTNIPINKVKWTANGKNMIGNILNLDDPEKYELIGTVGEGTEAEKRVVFNVTVTPSSGGRRRSKGSKGSKGTMKGKLVKLRRRMGTRVKRG
jgi:hypothetical protein